LAAEVYRQNASVNARLVAILQEPTAVAMAVAPTPVKAPHLDALGQQLGVLAL